MEDGRGTASHQSKSAQNQNAKKWDRDSDLDLDSFDRIRISKWSSLIADVRVKIYLTFGQNKCITTVKEHRKLNVVFTPPL